MADLTEIIKGRRSIRNYLDKEVPEEFLNQILESVRWSPSWNNTQCWEVIVVQDPANRESLQEIMPKFNPAWKALMQAPVVLVLCGKLKISGFYQSKALTKFGDWFMFDLGIAAQTICLTAHNLGLGTVIAGVFDHDKTKEMFGVPEGYEAAAVIPLGYPAKDSAAPKRREIGEFTHYEKF